MISFRRTDEYEERFCDREPGELQTGLNRLWKMVREELLSSRLGGIFPRPAVRERREIRR
ncbi:hypothetical protein [Paenibacillus humicus]|uniref:hypothetical protein n=1 Tax=Paenibacillus humicus TaxID=412861 RepID=UPI003D2734EA